MIKIDIPYTYYPKTEFSHKWLPVILLCDGFRQSHMDDLIERWENYCDVHGPVTRTLRRIN